MPNRWERRLNAAKLRTSLFRAERNRVLRSLDLKEMDKFFAKYNVKPPATWAADKPDVQLAVMHYARLQLPDDMTMVERLTSAAWLVERTYSLPSGYALVDGKLTFTKPNDPDGGKPNFGMDGPTDKDTIQ